MSLISANLQKIYELQQIVPKKRMQNNKITNTDMLIDCSTNCNWASPPNPLSLRRGGTSHLFLLIFRKYLKQETGEEKGNFSPPLLKERGLGGEAQLQLILHIPFLSRQCTWCGASRQVGHCTSVREQLCREIPLE